MKISLKAILSGLLLLVACCVGLTEAQSANEAIFTFAVDGFGRNIRFPDIQWAFDSQSFTFPYYVNALNPVTQPVHYTVTDNTVYIGESDCPVTLSEQQEQDLGLYGGCPQSGSPNERYVILSSGERACGEGGCSFMPALVDLETSQSWLIRKPVDNFYTIRWSENSSAFLILDFGQYGGVGGIWYVSVPEDRSGEIKPLGLSGYEQGNVGFVDIVPDGRRVLLRGRTEDLNRGMTLWNADVSATRDFAAWEDGRTLLADEIVAGGSFVPNDPDHLLLVIREGIIRYDLETDTYEVINPYINLSSG